MNRIEWKCPGCQTRYAVPDSTGLTLCPSCQADSQPLTVAVSCPFCYRKYTIDESLIGAELTCTNRSCGKEFRTEVPTGSETVPLSKETSRHLVPPLPSRRRRNALAFVAMVVSGLVIIILLLGAWSYRDAKARELAKRQRIEQEQVARAVENSGAKRTATPDAKTTSAITHKEIRKLPGISLEDVVSRFVGFERAKQTHGKDTSIDAMIYVTNLSLDSSKLRGYSTGNVAIFGESRDSAYCLDASFASIVLNPDELNELSLKYFNELANVEFEGANSVEAWLWIAENIGKNNVVTYFGGTKFELFASDSSRRFMITAPWKSP